MTRAGLFDDVDIALHWHAANANSASAGKALANKTAKFRFYGVSAHASGSPEKGRSALDGVEAMNNMVNMLSLGVAMPPMWFLILQRFIIMLDIQCEMKL